MTGVGGEPRDYAEFVRDTRRTLTALERRQTRVNDANLPPRLSTTGQLVTDWNTATEVGFYYATGGANAPTPGDYFAGVVEYDGVHNRVIQTLHVASGDTARQREEYRRVFASPLWTAWARVDNMPGTYTDISATVTLGTGWSFTGGLYATRVGNIVSMECPGLAVVAGTFSIPVDGNITNQNPITGIPEQWRPGRTQAVGHGGSGPGHGMYITSSGNVTLPWVVPSATQTGTISNAATTYSFGNTWLAGF